MYDFVILEYVTTPSQDTAYKLLVEKRPLEGNKLPTLDTWLKKEDVDDTVIGETIERLESIPNAEKSVSIVGRNGKILVEQI